MTHADGQKVLEVFAQAWTFTGDLPSLRQDLERQIAKIAREVTWNVEDYSLLDQHASNMETSASTHAPAVRQVLRSISMRHRFFTTGQVWVIHVLFWAVLLLVYPRSRQIQAIFFWNPWVRRFLGLGYVGFALTWIPLLRKTLFAPFKDSLLSDAGLEAFHPEFYFRESEVKEKVSGLHHPIQQAIPAIDGQIVLEGESGLGKSMFLRNLVQRSKRIVVYLPAEKCAQGVMEAIQAKLQGPAQDPRFLRNLIYSGALDLCIDGLNEVTADTRAQITQFVESYFKGNILLATQPFEWRPPSTARIYRLQPLTRDQIEQFLLTRQGSFPERTLVAGASYDQACQTYLAKALSENQTREGLEAARRILSNPMDLTLVAQMLAAGQDPDLFHLQAQQYEFMAADYKTLQLDQEFPLVAFSESIYQMRLKDEAAIPEEEFLEEIRVMERHKMVIIRQSLDAQGKPKKEWHFRHDKIMDFFIVHAFLGPENERPQKHIADPRFLGVYFLLAMLLPLKDAQALREQLIQYAADTKDHMISDTFIQLLRSRQVA